MGGRYATAGWLVLALAALAGGCQTKVVFDVANNSDDVRGVKVLLDDGSQYLLGEVGRWDRLVGELPIHPSRLPMGMTLHVGDLQDSFVLVDFVNADRIDQCFAVDGRQLVGPQMVPFPVHRRRTTGGGEGGQGGAGDDPPPTGGSGDGGDIIMPPPPPSLPGPMTDRQKRNTIYQQSLTLARMRLVSRGTILTDGEAVDSDVAGQAVRSRLVSLGFDVTADSAKGPAAAPGASGGEAGGCALELRVTGTSEPYDEYQGLYVYDAEVAGEIRNLRTGRVIATESFTALDSDREKRNVERQRDPVKAGRQALRSAAEKLADFLSDETCRRWREATLLQTRLSLANVATAKQLTDIYSKLRGRHGVHYVSLESWDESDRQAELDVLLTLSAEPALVRYVDELREGGVRVERYSSKDKCIDAWRKSGR